MNRFTGILFVAAAALMIGTVPGLARADAIECPLQITVHEQTDASALAGWQALSANAREIHHFYGVAFSQGSPADLAYLNPRKGVSKTKAKLEIYDFGPELKGELWISCLYRDTSQVVTKRIDPKPLKCQVVYDPKRVDAVKSVNCD